MKIFKALRRSPIIATLSVLILATSILQTSVVLAAPNSSNSNSASNSNSNNGNSSNKSSNNSSSSNNGNTSSNKSNSNSSNSNNGNSSNKSSGTSSNSTNGNSASNSNNGNSSNKSSGTSSNSTNGNSASNSNNGNSSNKSSGSSSSSSSSNSNNNNSNSGNSTNNGNGNSSNGNSSNKSSGSSSSSSSNNSSSNKTSGSSASSNNGNSSSNKSSASSSNSNNNSSSNKTTTATTNPGKTGTTIIATGSALINLNNGEGATPSSYATGSTCNWNSLDSTNYYAWYFQIPSGGPQFTAGSAQIYFTNSSGNVYSFKLNDPSSTKIVNSGKGLYLYTPKYLGALTLHKSITQNGKLVYSQANSAVSSGSNVSQPYFNLTNICQPLGTGLPLLNSDVSGENGFTTVPVKSKIFNTVTLTNGPANSNITFDINYCFSETELTNGFAGCSVNSISASPNKNDVVSDANGYAVLTSIDITTGDKSGFYYFRAQATYVDPASGQKTISDNGIDGVIETLAPGDIPNVRASVKSDREPIGLNGNLQVLTVAGPLRNEASIIYSGSQKGAVIFQYCYTPTIVTGGYPDYFSECAKSNQVKTLGAAGANDVGGSTIESLVKSVDIATPIVGFYYFRTSVKIGSKTYSDDYVDQSVQVVDPNATNQSVISTSSTTSTPATTSTKTSTSSTSNSCTGISAGTAHCAYLNNGNGAAPGSFSGGTCDWVSGTSSADWNAWHFVLPSTSSYFSKTSPFGMYIVFRDLSDVNVTYPIGNLVNSNVFDFTSVAKLAIVQQKSNDPSQGKGFYIYTKKSFPVSLVQSGSYALINGTQQWFVLSGVCGSGSGGSSGGGTGGGGSGGGTPPPPTGSGNSNLNNADGATPNNFGGGTCDYSPTTHKNWVAWHFVLPTTGSYFSFDTPHFIHITFNRVGDSGTKYVVTSPTTNLTSGVQANVQTITSTGAPVWSDPLPELAIVQINKSGGKGFYIYTPPSFKVSLSKSGSFADISGTQSWFVLSGVCGAYSTLTTSTFTQVSSISINANEQVRDSATVTFAPGATTTSSGGTVSFQYCRVASSSTPKYWPNDCISALSTANTKVIGTIANPTTISVESDPFTLNSAGYYLFHATYSGYGDYQSSYDDGINELVTVYEQPTISTQVSSRNIGYNALVYDVATLTIAGSKLPTGSIVFSYCTYNSPTATSGQWSDSACTNKTTYDTITVASFTGTAPNFTARSKSFNLPALGNYLFHAEYIPGLNDLYLHALENGAGEFTTQTDVIMSSTTLVTQASNQSITLNAELYDTATISIAIPETATLPSGNSAVLNIKFFYCYSNSTPNVPCAPINRVAFDTVTVTINSLSTGSTNNYVVTSKSIRPQLPGYYRFFANFDGDLYFLSSEDTNVGGAESFVVKYRPEIKTTVTAEAKPGDPITEVATFKVPVNSPQPSGSMVFSYCRYTGATPATWAACTTNRNNGYATISIAGLTPVTSGGFSTYTVTPTPLTNLPVGSYLFHASYSAEGVYLASEDDVTNEYAEVISPYLVETQPFVSGTTAVRQDLTVATGTRVFDSLTLTVTSVGPASGIRGYIYFEYTQNGSNQWNLLNQSQNNGQPIPIRVNVSSNEFRTTSPVSIVLNNTTFDTIYYTFRVKFVPGDTPNYPTDCVAPACYVDSGAYETVAVRPERPAPLSTPSPSPSPTVSPSASPSASPTVSPSASPSASPSPSPSVILVPTPTPVPSPTQSFFRVPIVIPTSGPQPTSAPAPEPTKLTEKNTVIVPCNAPVILKLSDLIGNADVKTLKITQVPSNGTLEQISATEFRFTPAPGTCNTFKPEGFTYTYTDANGVVRLVRKEFLTVAQGDIPGWIRTGGNFSGNATPSAQSWTELLSDHIPNIATFGLLLGLIFAWRRRSDA